MLVALCKLSYAKLASDVGSVPVVVVEVSPLLCASVCVVVTRSIVPEA